ncbi:MAG: ABC transporter ATP-binding protein [Acidimicrobiales bacterium]|nr:ABC transporter ATP-binding protein [Acidimicrobiales bacterium]MDP6521670.1 ABC transporter ATP-binding protein [SAR324 cluster bacterium]MDP6886817.1 ABC transporter ATP-binding protein [SAR324 cluster bacterium]MDP7332305.1 ABC transporter ATP-binding protein [SAR324 cluster bacterium]
MLKIKSISKHFGGVKALNELDLEVGEGDIFGVIGPNGSGKSTLINVICGIFQPTKGDVVFYGQTISGKPTHQRLKTGIARTFQNIRLFPNLTVWQNLWVARNSVEDIKTESSFYRWFGKSIIVKKEIEEMLEFSNLENRADELASSLAFGEQRRLELARAVATKPRLLLLDEPAAGMNKDEIRDLDSRIRSLQLQGITIILIEHVMELVMGVTDRIAVLNFGSKIAEGNPQEIQKNEAVQEAYLGYSEDD